MRTERFLFVLFVLLGVLFIIGSTIKLERVLMISHLLLVPTLVLYYRRKARKLFAPIVLVLLVFYVRDTFLLYDPEDNFLIIQICFLVGMLLLLLCLGTGFRKAKVHPMEVLSFVIMYSFLGFLFVSLSEVVPEVLPDRGFWAYTYLFLLMLLVAWSFTSYLLKSHLASLWFMVAASAFLVSEVSLFFKLFILEDFSVNFFYPFFHVLAYFGLVQYGMRRRLTKKLPFF